MKKKFGGVCSGLANFLGVPALWLRIFATIALIIEPIPILIGYGIAFWVLKNKFPEDTDQVDDSGQE
ncbi:MAG: PspC domain-containing protein [Pseudomonadota bacterium]|nr:PspC domain-containing protein [Pseudomonadota bacterium]